MSYWGRRAEYVVVDELTNHAADAFRYMTLVKGDTVTFSAPLPLWQEIKPLELPCSACGAPAGERCNRGPDPRTGKLRWRGFHFRRKDDARMATEAVRALNSQ